EALLQMLTNTIYRFKRIGLEAGPLSQWLYSVLAEAGLPVVCVETRHMRAMLKAQINKTDRNDARGIAQMMRVGLYRPGHWKTFPWGLQRSLLRGERRLGIVRQQYGGSVPARSNVYRSHSQGYESRGPAGSVAHQIRADRKPPDCKDTRIDH